MFKTNFIKFFLFFSAFSIILLNSCEDEKSPLTKYGPFFENVMRSEQGVFRGFGLGVQIDSILSNEPSEVKDADESNLYYEYAVEDLGSYNVSYTFNEKGLNEIHSDIYINNPEKTEEIFNSFKTYFDEHYGPSQTEMGYTIWSIKSELFSEVKINLSNESSDFTVTGSPGKVSIWIYPDK